MHLPGAIGGDDDDRRLCGLDGAEFRDAQLEVGEKLEEECLERFVGPIEFVDEQYRRSSGVGFEGAKQRPGYKVIAAVDAAADVCGPAFRFRHPNRHHLPGVIPLIRGAGEVQAFVTLQADEVPAESPGKNVRYFRFTDARFAFQEQRPAHAQREINDGCEVTAGNVVAAAKQVLYLVEVLRQRNAATGVNHLSSSPRAWP